MIMSALLQPFFSAFFACLYVMVVDSANRAAQKLIRGTGYEEGSEGGLVMSGVTMIFLRWGWTVHRILAKSSMTLFLVSHVWPRMSCTPGRRSGSTYAVIVSVCLPNCSWKVQVPSVVQVALLAKCTGSWVVLSMASWCSVAKLL